MPLIFGLSWHDAMDVLWGRYGQVDDRTLLKESLEAFHARWIEQGLLPAGQLTLEMIEKLGARTPMVAAEMLINYLNARRSTFENSSFQLEAIEQPFAVPIFEDRPNIWYIGRLDKTFSINGYRVVGEHKTTSEYAKDSGFKLSYVESWNPSSQVEGYLYAANLYYPGGARYVYLDASLVHKKEHGYFKFIPIAGSLAALDQWLFDTRFWINEVEKETETLQSLVNRASDSALWAFPRSTNACSGKYGLCPYIDICRSVPNPEALSDPPAGFIYDPWMPFDVLQIEKLGLPPEEIK